VGSSVEIHEKELPPMFPFSLKISLASLWLVRCAWGVWDGVSPNHHRFIDQTSGKICYVRRWPSLSGILGTDSRSPSPTLYARFTEAQANIVWATHEHGSFLALIPFTIQSDYRYT
jgi:hypothetical protein